MLSAATLAHKCGHNGREKPTPPAMARFGSGNDGSRVDSPTHDMFLSHCSVSCVPVSVVVTHVAVVSFRTRMYCAAAQVRLPSQLVVIFLYLLPIF